MVNKAYRLRSIRKSSKLNVTRSVIATPNSATVRNLYPVGKNNWEMYSHEF